MNDQEQPVPLFGKDDPSALRRATAREPVLFTVEEAASRLGIGRTKMFSLIREGALRTVQIGRLRRIAPDDLEAYIQQLRHRGAA